MTYNSLYSPVNVNDYLKFGTVVVVMIDSEYNNKHRQRGDNAQEKIVEASIPNSRDDDDGMMSWSKAIFACVRSEYV